MRCWRCSHPARRPPRCVNSPLGRYVAQEGGDDDDRIAGSWTHSDTINTCWVYACVFCMFCFLTPSKTSAVHVCFEWIWLKGGGVMTKQVHGIKGSDHRPVYAHYIVSPQPAYHFFAPIYSHVTLVITAVRVVWRLTSNGHLLSLLDTEVVEGGCRVWYYLRPLLCLSRSFCLSFSFCFAVFLLFLMLYRGFFRGLFFSFIFFSLHSVSCSSCSALSSLSSLSSSFSPTPLPPPPLYLPVLSFSLPLFFSPSSPGPSLLHCYGHAHKSVHPRSSRSVPRSFQSFPRRHYGWRLALGFRHHLHRHHINYQ
jgi:hypothetical protein